MYVCHVNVSLMYFLLWYCYYMCMLWHKKMTMNILGEKTPLKLNQDYWNETSHILMLNPVLFLYNNYNIQIII